MNNSISILQAPESFSPSSTPQLPSSLVQQTPFPLEIRNPLRSAQASPRRPILRYALQKPQHHLRTRLPRLLLPVHIRKLSHVAHHHSAVFENSIPAVY